MLYISKRILTKTPIFMRPMVQKISVYVICLCGVLVCTGCDGVYRILHKEGAQERDLIGDVVPFESNPKVEEIQNLLKLYGFYAGGVDGKLGPNTRYAIERFQKAADLKVTRFVDDETWAGLNVFSENGLVVEGEVNITMVQTALKSAGFSPGTIDGKAGPRTERSLKKFQKAMGLKDDGTIGFNTLRELNYFLPYE